MSAKRYLPEHSILSARNFSEAVSTQTPIQIKSAAKQATRQQYFIRCFFVVYAVVFFVACMPQPPASGVGGGVGAGQPHAMTPFEFIFQTVTFFLMGLFVYYLLVLKPANDRNSQRATFFDGLKKNDEVLINGGIYGRVFAVKPDGVTVEIAQGVRVRVKPESLMAAGSDGAQNGQSAAKGGSAATNGGPKSGLASGKSEA
jgi:preprotein translocase subunit YajC